MRFRTVAWRLRVRPQPFMLPVIPTDDIDRVAAVSGVPAALLELMASELSSTDGDRGFVLRERSPRRRSRRPRQRVVAVVVIEIAAAANIAACIVALMRQETGLGVLTAVIAGALTLAVALLARLLSPPASSTEVQRQSRIAPRGRGQG